MDGLVMAARSPASGWKVGQFGWSLRYAVTALADLGVAGHTGLRSRMLLGLSPPSQG